jgi:hypothetical protein
VSLYISIFLQLWISRALPLSQPPIASVRPPWELLPYVLPELFDEATDRSHRSYHSTICGAELGTVRFRGPGYYMPLQVEAEARSTGVGPSRLDGLLP